MWRIDFLPGPGSDGIFGRRRPRGGSVPLLSLCSLRVCVGAFSLLDGSRFVHILQIGGGGWGGAVVGSATLVPFHQHEHVLLRNFTKIFSFF